MLVRPALAALALSIAMPSAAHAASGVFAGSLGVPVPKGAEASVRAVDRATGTIQGAANVGRKGTFSLSLPPGTYLVVGSVVRPDGKPVVKKVGVSLRSGQKRRGTKLTAKKRKTRSKKRARASYAQESGKVTPGKIALGIYPFTGSTGDRELDVVAPGISDLILTDVLAKAKCGGISVVEVARRADVIRELEFQQSRYVDPATRAVRNLILEDVTLKGSIRPGAGGKPEMVATLANVKDGRVLGSYKEAVGDDVFGAEERLVEALIKDLCSLSDVYEVRIENRGEGHFAGHTGSGEVRTSLIAKRAQRGSGDWTGTGTMQWTGVTFASRDECATVDPVTPETSWTATLTDLGEGSLTVSWFAAANNGPTVSKQCPPSGTEGPPPPFPGLPGPSLFGATPMSFTVPYAGGTQPITGGVQDGGDGYFNNGTITVTPMGAG